MQNKLNWGFINTLICAAVMLATSHLTPFTQEDERKAAYVRQSSAAARLTVEETRKYRLFLGALALLLAAVAMLFSPLGVGR